MFMRRRPLVRAAVVGGVAYHAGKKVQSGRDEDAQADPGAPAEEPMEEPGSAEPTAGSEDMTTQLENLKKLLDEGVLTQAEFDMQKQKLLASS
jgi:hypothetical protein